jgi:hypothetical protein
MRVTDAVPKSLFLLVPAWVETRHLALCKRRFDAVPKTTVFERGWLTANQSKTGVPPSSCAIQCVVCQIWNSFGLRACLLHHFHQSFPSLSRIAYLRQECDAGTTHAIRGFQSDMKTKAIDCGHRRIR